MLELFGRSSVCGQWRHLWLLWPILPSALLFVAENALLFTQLPFIKGSFFAQRRLLAAGRAAEAAVSCGDTPKEMLCKVAMADAAYWDGLLEGLSGTVAIFTGLALGVWSDGSGRRWLLQLKGGLGVLSAMLL
ncbi:unnamed protein product, partial [Effrenium voratum]